MANMTLDECFGLAFRLINEYSVNGTAISSTNGNYVDIKNRMYPAANSSYQEVCKISQIEDVEPYSQHVPTNLLNLYGFNEEYHTDEDLTYSATGAQAFTFEVDSDCTVTFKEDISGTLTDISGTYTLANGSVTPFTGSISISSITTFTNCRGLLTLSSTDNDVYMIFSGSYPFTVRYRGLFANTWSSASKVIALRPYIQYTLPADFMKERKVLFSYDERQYMEFADYKIQNGKLELPWSQKGQFDLLYTAYPERITASTLGTFEFKCKLDAQAIIPYKVGGEAIMPDDASLGTMLLNIYDDMKRSLEPTDNIQSGTIVSVARGEW